MMVTKPVTCLLLCAALASGAFSQTTGVPAIAYKIQETPAGPVDPGIIDSVYSPDGRHIAYVTPQELRRDPEDGSPIGYAAPPGKKQHVAVDGKAGAAYDEIPSYPVVFSADGAHIAYQARNGTQWYVVVDNQAGPAYDEILKLPFKPLFSPDNKHIAYTAKKDGKMVVVLDAQEGPEFDIVNYCQLVFSPDSARLAYNARTDSHKAPDGRIDTQRMAAVIDGQIGPKYDFVGPPAFSSDGQHVGYSVTQNGRSFWILDGKESTDTETITGAKMPEAINAVRADNNQEMVVAIDGHAGPAYRGMGPLIFSADHKRVAYEAMTISQNIIQWRVVIDGKEDPVFTVVGERPGFGSSHPVFSPNGQHVAYGARMDQAGNQKWMAIVDGKEGAKFDGIAETTFSPDSAHWAYRAQKGKQWLVVRDTQQEPAFDDIAVRSVIFSPDSQHMIYKAKKDGKWVVVTDGKAGAEYDNVGPIQFNSDGTLEFLAIKQNNLYRVKYTPTL